MIFYYLFLFLILSKDIDKNSNPTINEVLQVKTYGFEKVRVYDILAYKVTNTLFNSSKKYDIKDIILKLDVYNKNSILIASKRHEVNFTKRKKLRKPKGFFQRIYDNLKNFIEINKLRKKIKENKTIYSNSKREYVLYFYNNDILSRIEDRTPVSLRVVPVKARIND